MDNRVTFHFKKPGLQTTIQDCGRLGQQNSGVPIGGAMDKSSAAIANWLVGNHVNAPVLEITLMGPEIVIEGDCQIALTGADMSPKIDGAVVDMYETISISSNSTLSFGRIKTGCRTYLAIRGQWLVPKWLNSFSAASHSAKDLTPDSILDKKSVLSVSTEDPIPSRALVDQLRPRYQEKILVGVLSGPEFDTFSKLSIESFFGPSYKITTSSNRMGYRLDTELVDFNPKQEVISSGVLPGTIQITNSGQPIILMADAQTTGGYPRIGNVISAHLDRLAQLKPGDEVSFSLMTLKVAYQALWDWKRTLRMILSESVS